MILLVTGAKGFCEVRPGMDHMHERRSLGWTLDFIKPDAVISDGEPGAGRWARIWAEKRGIDVTAGRPDYCLSFDGGPIPEGVSAYQVKT